MTFIKTLPTLSIIAFVLSSGLAGAALAEGLGSGDAEAGKKVFAKCKACHQVGADAKTTVGPILNGVVGRAARTGDFKYSNSMVAKGADDGLIWTPEALDAFLLKPRDFVPGTKMSFAGLRKEEDRANVIAYLATFTE